MSEKKKRETPSLSQFARGVRAFLGSGGFKAILVLLALALPIGGAVWAWKKWGGPIVGSADYILQPECLEVTPQPAWIRADVKAEVLQSGGLIGRSILEERLTIYIAEAFASHAWVEKVMRVSKHHPARVVVDVTYREPVAMVEVTLDGQAGLLPIDASGVLLPPDDFRAADAAKYLRIAAAEAAPAGGIGEAWGDPRIDGAARIAGLLLDHWQRIGIFRVVAHASGDEQDTTSPPNYELASRNGTRVIWGRAPAAASAAQAEKDAKKLAALIAFIGQNGNLNEQAEPVDIDLRDGFNVVPRTASHRLIPPLRSTR